VVEIETDGGLIGIGETGTCGGNTRHVIDALPRPMLIGEGLLLIAL
jgi:L-alanine-DL-glutamate epimerase-like enolase superfamily enzyme